MYYQCDPSNDEAEVRRLREQPLCLQNATMNSKLIASSSVFARRKYDNIFEWKEPWLSECRHTNVELDVLILMCFIK